MVLNCDVCHQNVSSAGGLNPSICLFPCFHKYCEQCKTDVLNASCQQPNNGGNQVTCRLCHIVFPVNVLYDHSESQIEKIFCLHCNIKNKAPVEWRCKTCQDRFLCSQCSQPHYHSGHEIEPMMKPNIPFRSQCNTHVNLPAMYLCSCQARLCNYCLNAHANGQITPPHEQRVSFAKLADQARLDLETIRRQSKTDIHRVQTSKDAIGNNKELIHAQASQARTAVANEVLELVNMVIRRGNDIVTHIDLAEDAKLKQCNQMEQEMRFWLDRLKKIESFSENALLTVQQDHPGMWSASMFAQSAVSQLNRRREASRATQKALERGLNMLYQSDLTSVANAIRSFGWINEDGEPKIPPQSTPSNARMFTLANGQMNQPNNVVVHPGHAPPVPSGAPIRQGQPNMFMGRPQAPPPQIAEMPMQGSSINVSINLPSRGPPPNLPSQMQRPPAPLRPATPAQQTTTPIHSPLMPPPPHSLNAIQSGSRAAFPPCSLPTSNAMLNNNTPPIPSPEQLQIMRQNAMLITQQQQQQAVQLPKNIPPERQNLQQQQQQQMLLRQQQQMHAQQLSEQQAAAAHQQALQNRACQQQLEQQQQMNMAQQQRMYQQQQTMLQQQQHHLQGNAAHQPQGSSSTLAQPQQLQQMMNTPNSQANAMNGSPPIQPQQQRQNVDATPVRPPILLRLPNPRQLQASNPQNINSPLSSSSVASTPRMNTPPNAAIVQMLNSPPIILPDRVPDVQQPKQSQQTSQDVPEVVELLDDEEVDEAAETQHFENQQANEEPTKTPETIVMGEGECAGEPQRETTTTLDNSPNRQQPPPMPRQKEKAESVAADSTVTSTSTPNNGLSGEHNESAEVACAETGVKRKSHEAHSEMHVPNKRSAVVENLIDDDEAERKNKNTSPVVISSTTTTENGEAVVSDATIGASATTTEDRNAPTTPSVLKEEDGDARQQRVDEQKSTVPNSGQQHNSNGEKHQVNGGICGGSMTQTNQQEAQHDATTSRPPIGETMPSVRSPKDEGGTSNTMSITDENRRLQQPTATPKSATKVVSPIQLMRMAANVSNSVSALIGHVTALSNAQGPEAIGRNQQEDKKGEPNAGNSPKLVRTASGGDDMWDDYCYVCSQGCDETTGSLGCCETCPHVFHARCHVPKINGRMEDLPDDWHCTICLPCEPLTQQSQVFGDRERLLCAKVYLACFDENNQVEIFLNNMPATEVDYHSIIQRPIWLFAIAEKISSRQYEKISQFVDEMNLLFQNFSKFNPPNNPLANVGKNVYSRFVNGMRKYLPAYEKQIWLYVSLYNSRIATITTAAENQARHFGLKLRKRGRRGREESKSQTP